MNDSGYTYPVIDVSLLRFFAKDVVNFRVKGTRYSDFSFLSLSNKIENLDLGCNGIEDASFISHLPKLKTVDLSENKITKIAIKDNPLLEELGLEKNEITEISLSNLDHLQELDISKNRISEF